MFKLQLFEQLNTLVSLLICCRSPVQDMAGIVGQAERAAAWVLDKYYTEFPIYNPYLDRVTSSRHRKGVKMYDFDGQSGINVS